VEYALLLAKKVADAAIMEANAIWDAPMHAAKHLLLTTAAMPKRIRASAHLHI
jgi:hypothetical protein